MRPPEHLSHHNCIPTAVFSLASGLLFTRTKFASPLGSNNSTARKKIGAQTIQEKKAVPRFGTSGGVQEES